MFCLRSQGVAQALVRGLQCIACRSCCYCCCGRRCCCLLPLCFPAQINPLAETRDGKLVAADAKLGFDDNAAYRQKELFAMRDHSQEDPRCSHCPCSEPMT